MSEMIINTGGSNADSDELTAYKSHVLSGYSAITHDSDGDPTVGTMPNNGTQSGSLNCGQSKTIPSGYTSGGTITANSLASQTGGATAEDNKVLANFRYWKDGVLRTGIMPNNGAQNASLNCGQSKYIPAGYTSGSTVTANSLASQTGGATADDNKVLANYTYWKDGLKHTGALSVSSVVSFSVAQYSNLTLIASWANPSKGPWSGLRVICKQGSYPTDVNDGTVFYEGSGESAINNLSAGIWYFRAWSFLTTNVGRMYGEYVQGSCTNIQIRGQRTFTSSGIFTAPENVRSIEFFGVGGGGGTKQDAFVPSGGAGGGSTKTTIISVIPGAQYQVNIGAGGRGTVGGSTSFGSFSVSGGDGNSGRDGNDGGSGGGGACWGTPDPEPGRGGSDGNNGEPGILFDNKGVGNQTASGGTGQGTTTRAFGESSGTLYAGGGGGYGDLSSQPGYGGDGGGAKQSNDAAANTGGGAGGMSNCGEDYEPSIRTGGSGIAIIRWGY